MYGFTRNELCAMCDALNGTFTAGSEWREHARHRLSLEVHDACKLHDLDKKWDCERNSINRKIESLSVPQAQRLTAAIGRFWQHAQLETNAALEVAGLLAPTAYLLNSAVIAAGCYGSYSYEAATPADLKRFLSEQDPVSRIGYPDTVAMIERLTGYRPQVSRALSIMDPGDQAMVLRLRYRVFDPRDKGAPVSTRLEDWEIARLTRLQEER